MRVTVFIASHSEPEGTPTLRQGDRAAVHWGVSLAGSGCEVRVPLGDRTASTYAAAVGAKVEPLDNKLVATCDLVLIGPGAIDAYGDELAGQLSEQLSAELI